MIYAEKLDVMIVVIQDDLCMLLLYEGWVPLIVLR